MITSHISINGQSYPFIFRLGSIFFYEEAKGERFSGLKSTFDTFVMYYSCLLSGAEKDGTEFPYTFQELLDLCDEIPSIAVEMSKALVSQMDARSANDGRAADDKKKD